VGEPAPARHMQAAPRPTLADLQRREELLQALVDGTSDMVLDALEVG
jgi:hypothetical protein